MDKLQINTVRKSLLTPMMFMGGERELSLMLILISVVLVVLIQTWTALFLGSALYVCAMPLLRIMGKKDPQMSKVYQRSLAYQSYYPAASTPHCVKDIKRTSAKFKR